MLRTETDVKEWLKRKVGSRLLVQSVESGSTGLGIPDLFVRTRFHDYWAEVKRGRLRRDGVTEIHWRPGQLRWLRAYAKLGGRSLLIVLDRTDLDEQGLSLFSGPAIREAYARGEYAGLAAYRASLKTFDLSAALRAIGDY